jgi:hypothetical protein
MEQEEIGVLKKETKSLCRILGEMQQELDVLTALVAQQASKRKEQCRNDDRRKREDESS